MAIVTYFVLNTKLTKKIEPQLHFFFLIRYPTGVHWVNPRDDAIAYKPRRSGKSH